MYIPQDTNSLVTILQQRRENLAQLINFPVILWSGKANPRNFPANRFPFRASSHFLYFAGLSLENAAIRLENGELELFMADSNPDSLLWHGETLPVAKIAELIGAKGWYPLEKLSERAENCATVCVQDMFTSFLQANVLSRPIYPANAPEDLDLELAKAIIKLRLGHDSHSISEVKNAVNVSIAAHKAGIKATVKAKNEAEVRAAMEAEILAANMTCSYNSIVTVHGEILHNETYFNDLKKGDLLLADVGAETPLGWSADLTRTFPVTGKFSPTQRDIYEVVLAAHDQSIAKISPNLEYQDIHLLAAKIITEGLINLGILKGDPEDLVNRDVYALFFPHGIGHLLGLDVHDMEDLGDLAGYGENRFRSDRFGLGYLRLNRPLKIGMIVTIEPGFYQVPAILNNPTFRNKYHHDVNWDKLSNFADVKGIRIEDDVLVTDACAEVLSINLPTQIDELEQLIINN
jgi:Xaa-Pro aminopeptidase